MHVRKILAPFDDLGRARNRPKWWVVQKTGEKLTDVNFPPITHTIQHQILPRPPSRRIHCCRLPLQTRIARVRLAVDFPNEMFSSRAERKKRKQLFCSPYQVDRKNKMTKGQETTWKDKRNNWRFFPN